MTAHSPHVIQCEIDRTEGSLQRLIGLIERRGFNVAALQMAAAAPGARRRISVSVSPRDAGRCVQVLGRQIDRLYGVRRVADAAFASAEAA